MWSICSRLAERHLRPKQRKPAGRPIRHVWNLQWWYHNIYIYIIYIYLGSRNPLKIKCLERNLGSYRILKKTSGSVPKPKVCFLETVLNPYLTEPILNPYFTRTNPLFFSGFENPGFYMKTSGFQAHPTFLKVFVGQGNYMYTCFCYILHCTLVKNGPKETQVMAQNHELFFSSTRGSYPAVHQIRVESDPGA